jgi:hypothetical protein
LSGADQEGEAACGQDQAGGGGEDEFELFVGAQGDQIGAGGEVLGAAVEDGGIRKG